VTDLWEWHQQIVGGDIQRKTISVVLLDSLGGEKWRWVFRDAYPVKWNGTDLNATGNTVAVESIEFAHHGMTKI
jgi:phage tail-like protein